MSALSTSGHVDGVVEKWNCLLQSESAAVEAYTQVILMFEDQHVLAHLHSIREEHLDTQRMLRDLVNELGGLPIETLVASSVSSPLSANALAPAASLIALKRGEELAINELEDCLKQDYCDHKCKNLIRTVLLPAAHKRVDVLDRLTGGMADPES